MDEMGKKRKKADSVKGARGLKREKENGNIGYIIMVLGGGMGREGRFCEREKGGMKGGSMIISIL